MFCGPFFVDKPHPRAGAPGQPPARENGRARAGTKKKNAFARGLPRERRRARMEIRIRSPRSTERVSARALARPRDPVPAFRFGVRRERIDPGRRQRWGGATRARPRTAAGRWSRGVGVWVGTGRRPTLCRHPHPQIRRRSLRGRPARSRPPPPRGTALPRHRPAGGAPPFFFAAHFARIYARIFPPKTRAQKKRGAGGGPGDQPYGLRRSISKWPRE